MVSMIPFGLLAGFAGEKEVRITGLDETGFEFRVKKGAVFQKEKLKVCFWDLEYGKYKEIEIAQPEVKKDTKNQSEFFECFWVQVDQPDYLDAVQKLLSQYSKYIHLKLDDDDSMLAKELTGYPGELDEIKCTSLEEQVAFWRKKQSQMEAERDFQNTQIQPENEHPRENPDAFQLALEVDRPYLYQVYLENPMEIFWEKCVACNENLCKLFVEMGKIVQGLYIGNQFCPLLFPEEKLLFQMMEKAASEHMEITVAFSYVREDMLKDTGDLLRKIDQWCEQKKRCIEVVVNDWGMAEMVKNNTRNVIPQLGILLNKRKKDPRIFYKKGDQKLFQRTNLNGKFYTDYLKNTWGICGFEWESCGYEQQFPEGKNSLHIPFYQTNTSQYCPVYAMCTRGERGSQTLPVKCPEYCNKYAFLYPEHLCMFGRYNSLFGVDMKVLSHRKVLEKYIENGVNRVVVSLLETPKSKNWNAEKS